MCRICIKRGDKMKDTVEALFCGLIADLGRVAISLREANIITLRELMSLVNAASDIGKVVNGVTGMEFPPPPEIPEEELARDEADFAGLEARVVEKMGGKLVPFLVPGSKLKH